MVRALVDNDPEITNKILDHQEKLVHDLLPALEKAEHEKIIEIIKNGEENLEKLGVVSDYAKKIIRSIEESGGAAKICGAGGTTKATGIILSYHLNLQSLSKVLQFLDLNPAQLDLGVEGLREE